MAYNTSQKLKDNTEAIRIALKHQPGGYVGTSDLEQLKKYSGFGGIKSILYPAAGQEEWTALNATEADMRLYDPIMELHGMLKEHFKEEYPQVISALKSSVLTAFYTPAIVPQIMFHVLKEAGAIPKRLYETSAGAGVFITEGLATFPGLDSVTAVEKDLLTGKILQAITDGLAVNSDVQIRGLENTDNNENGKFDLVVSNIPFGNINVYDPAFKDNAITGKIHNYFFAKGLDKIADGGLLAYITTNAFLDSPSNEQARKYLFSHADLVSVAVMPDNLMKDSGNTEAPSHLLIVQKNDQKTELTLRDQLLIQTTTQENEFGVYNRNRWLQSLPELNIGNDIQAGKDQYGRAHQTVWQHGDLKEIAGTLTPILLQDFAANFNLAKYELAKRPLVLPQQQQQQKRLTLKDVPAEVEAPAPMQLGLFDSAPEIVNRAMAYVTGEDGKIIQKQSARIIGRISTTEQPEHETIVLLTARSFNNSRYLYKLVSNTEEIKTSRNWMIGSLLQTELKSVSGKLKQFDHDYQYEGDRSLESGFDLRKKDHSLFRDVNPLYKEGTLVIKDGKPGRINQINHEKSEAVFEALEKPGKPLSFYQSYIEIRDTYLNLSQAEKTPGSNVEALRKEAAEYYDRFLEPYGALNHPNNKTFITNDSAFGLTMLSSLERKDGSQYVPSDILRASLKPKEESFITDDPAEALARSLNDHGKVNLDFIISATGQTTESAIAALSGKIYLNPQDYSWETVDQYLSGNVVEKLRLAEIKLADAPDDEYIRSSRDALARVQPEIIPFEVLDFNLGERWIPLDYYTRFASELLANKTTVSYLRSGDIFKVVSGKNTTQTDEEFAVVPLSGYKTYGYTLLEHALENTAPWFTYSVKIDGKEVRYPDSEATQLANQKIELIRTRFVEFLQALPEEEKRGIEKLYNDTFNCYRLREYNGSHLKFPGLDLEALKIPGLYNSQKDAAWRLIQNRGGLVDHEVGLGKTLTIVVTAMEMKRLGICHKPMILALKANVDQIAATFKTAYPNAKVLFPGQQDFTPRERQRIFNEIRNNNWDAVILTHDQFGKIPQSPEIQKIILSQELNNVEADLDTMKELGGDISKKMLKGLEVRKNNIEAQVKEATDKIKSKNDQDIDFETMGVDHLFIDESHKFKNLTYTTRHNRVAGLGNTTGSQRALNLLFAIRTLQSKYDSDLCVTFLSGTPISNSLTEMYLIFKYLRPKEMERQRIENFDGWAAVFAKKTTDFEFSVTNEIIAKERFRHFIKVPELAMFYNEVTDYKTAAHINLDRPQKVEHLVNLKPTEEQVLFIEALMKFAKTGDAEYIGRAKLTESEDNARMLIATNYAKKMAADLRLIDSEKYDDHPGNKVSVCAKQVAEIYFQTRDHRGTQLIFSDIGTPKPDQFNVYDALKQKLITEYNIPAHEITFAHDWTEKSKPQMFKMMNRGDVRIALGSTDKLGTGTNVQERIVAMHHLDIPWRPSDLEQRDGRGIRQGNRIAKEFYNNKVDVFIYAVEQSLDSYKFSLLKNKQTFISQMKNNALHVRTLDEGAFDEQTGMNFAEYIAVLSGDTSLLEKSKIDKKVAALESLKGVHGKEIARARYKLESLKRDLNHNQETLASLHADHDKYKGLLRVNEKGNKLNPIQLSGFKLPESEAIGKHLVDLYLHWKPKEGYDEQKIGSLYGFDLYIRAKVEMEHEDGKYVRKQINTFYARNEDRPDGIRYTFNSGHPNVDNLEYSARHFLNAIDKSGDLIERYQKETNEIIADIPQMERLSNKGFDKEPELQQLKTEQSRLEREINQRIVARQEAAMPKEETEAKIIALDPMAQEPARKIRM